MGRLIRKGALTLGALALLAGAASAELFKFQLSLDGGQEVPPVATGGTGQANVTLNDATGFVVVSGTYTGLTGTENAAHIHGPAPVGMNAPPIITLAGTGGMSGSISGSGTLTAAQVQDMKNGLHYINIHSTAHGGGEIRGQIANGVTVPAASPLGWGALIAALAGAGLWTLRRLRKAPA